MTESRAPRRRTVKTRVLLAAAAGATTLSLQSCPLFVANLMVAPIIECGPDGGPVDCTNPSPQPGSDGGTTGGDH